MGNIKILSGSWNCNAFMKKKITQYQIINLNSQLSGNTNTEVKENMLESIKIKEKVERGQSNSHS